MMQQTQKHGQGFLSFLKERTKIWVLVGVALLGIFLLIMGASGTEKSKNSEDELNARTLELSSYQASLEKEIETLCESVAGVSDCTVMVTLSKGYAVTYATDKNGDPATVGNGSNEEALFENLSPPTVVGVGIVCRGGRDARVQALLTELVSTALGISGARVYVTGK